MTCPILNKMCYDLAYETIDTYFKGNIVPSVSNETMKGADVELYLANS